METQAKVALSGRGELGEWEGTEGNEEDFSGRAQRIGKADGDGGKSTHWKMQSE